jgi:hypothetical protein
MSRWFSLRSLISAACLLGLFLACFGPALRPGRQLAYRDYSDFYYPLYQRVQQEWEQGRLPLWANEENCGSPLLGNPTAAVLYPGKMIYAILPYPVAAKVYVVTHVMIAFVTMVSLLRRWDVSAIGSTFGGLAYAFGAPVLTQYCNVVFLIGAAWMPLGFRFADGWIRLGRPRSIAGLGFVLAMQVLGGDPEAAYLTAFASAAYAAGRWVAGDPQGRALRVAITAVALLGMYGTLLAIEYWTRPVPLRGVLADLDQPSFRISIGSASLAAWVLIGMIVVVRGWSRRGRASFEGRLLGLAGACGLALALSGAQLVPTLEFIGQSTRNNESNSVDIYMQSIHPARIIEWIWPTAFGSTFGLNRNWLIALPPTNDHNIWMNSLYLGGLTILLASCALGSRNGPAGRRWMVGVALVGVLGGFGDFASPIFWARAIPGGEARFGMLEEAEPVLPRADGLLRDGDGGVYWFLSSALPGFRSFRYPGKLFIPAALGICALAGMGFDGLITGRRRVGLVLAWGLLVASLIKLSFSFIQPSTILKFLEGRAELARSGFGPFDPSGALIDLRLALIHGSIAMASFLVLARLAPRNPKLTGILALLILSVDLALANRGQVGIVSQAAYEEDPRTLAAIRKSEREFPEPGPFRVFRLHAWAPRAWNQAGSPDRVEEMIRWERDTLRSKYEITLGISSTFSFGAAELAEIPPFFQPFLIPLDPAKALSLKIPVDRPASYYPRRGFDLWNTRYFILPARMSWTVASRGFASLLPDAKAIYPGLFIGPDSKSERESWASNEDVQVVRNRAAFPRAWVVHQAIPVGPTTSLTESSRRKLMAELLYQDDELWHIEGLEPEDPRRVAWVEATRTQLAGLAGAREAAEPVRYLESPNPNRVELEVTLTTPGLVVLADVFYPGWHLEIDGKTAEILRTNRAMRGAVVPAGTHRLVYTYRPGSLTIGLVLSLLGLLALVTLVGIGGRK